MSEAVAFEAAIRAEREERTPKLVYADWLDENGDPTRAKLLRDLCRLQIGETVDPYPVPVETLRATATLFAPARTRIDALTPF